MQVAIYMDHPSLINYATDSTFILGLELEKRGYDLVFLDAESMCWYGHEIELNGMPLSFMQSYPFYHLENRKALNLADIGLILIRKDPPFDMSYVTCTYLLERFTPSACIVNSPAAVRNFNDKFLSLDLHYLMPPTLITSSMKIAKEFCKEHGECVIKSLYSSRSRETFYINNNDVNFDNIWNLLMSGQPNVPLSVQKFLPKIYQGDKRVFIVDGQILHAYSRIPKTRDFRASMSCGASVAKTTLTKREQEVSEEVAILMRKNNVFWAGIDLIDGYLIEVNITSPTGLQAVTDLYRVKMESTIVDAMEKHANLR